MALIEKVSKPEAHPSLQERISELQSELQTLSFHSAACRKIQAEIDNILKKKVLKNHRMAFTSINRLLTTYRRSDEGLEGCLCAALFVILLGKGCGENGERLQERIIC